MEFSTRLIKQIAPEAVFSGVAISNEPFTYLNCAVPTGELSNRIDTTRTLYFPVHEENVEVLNWYENDFDRRPHLDKLSSANPEWVFVLDDSCKNVSVKSAIIVPDVYELIEKLYRFVLRKVKPIVVGVTGSVGKTTAAAMLESGLGTQLKCLRMYSKRITPLVLWASIINFLDRSIRVVIVEIAIYEKGHVKWFSDNISLDISVILNVRRMHIGSAGADENEILHEKAEIVRKNSIAVLNYDDDLIRSHSIFLEHSRIQWFSIDELQDEFLVTHQGQGVFNVYVKGVYLFDVTLFLATELSVYQALVTFTVARLLNLNLVVVAGGVSKFSGREGRLIQKNIKGLRIFFDGETSYPARLHELSKNLYDRSALLVSELNFGEQDLDLICEDFPLAISNFDLVRISTDVVIPKRLKDLLISLSKANIQFTSDLIEDLDGYSIVFYHHGGERHADTGLCCGIKNQKKGS